MKDTQLHYICIRDLKIEDCKFEQGWLVIGMPPIPAIHGWLINNFRKVVGDQILSSMRFAWAIKGNFSNSFNKVSICLDPTSQHFGKNRIRRDFRGVVYFDLVISMDLNEIILKEVNNFIKKSNWLVANSKIAKGRVTQQCDEKCCISTIDNQSDLEDWVDKNLPNRYWVTDASSELQHHHQGWDGKYDSLENLLDYLEQPTKDKVEYIRRVPCVIGYQIIEKPNHKKKAREGMKHAHAEPVLSAVKLIPVISKKQYVFESIFWKWLWVGDKYIGVGE